MPHWPKKRDCTSFLLTGKIFILKSINTTASRIGRDWRDTEAKHCAAPWSANGAQRKSKSPLSFGQVFPCKLMMKREECEWKNWKMQDRKSTVQINPANQIQARTPRMNFSHAPQCNCNPT